MFPGPDEQMETRKRGLDGTGGRAGDARNEPDDAPTQGSDADEVSMDSATPGGIAESLTEALSDED